jgi:Ca2+-binding RTX toxin-like protein
MANPIYGRYRGIFDCYVIMGQTLRRTGPQMKRSGGAIAPAVLAKRKAPAGRDILIGEPETDELRAFGGSRSDKFNGVLINAMARTGWFPPGQTDEACNQQMFAAVAALRAFKPADEIEGMLAAQTVAMHFGAMECFRRAMVHDGGSNFLAGGNGNDTFFVNDLDATTPSWTTIEGFHTGDAATIWGLTPTDFQFAWMDGGGAVGHQGLTLYATAPNKPEIAITLAGASVADLSSGKLDVQFGKVNGTNYMEINHL